jgi:hypothetical protein
MGNSQLFLMVLSGVIVVVAIAVGIEQFNSMTIDANRDAMTADLTHYASKAQLYFRTSRTYGGGSQDFKGFRLNTFENSTANGDYRVDTSAPGDNTAVSPGGEIFVSATTIYIIGSGRRTGEDDANPVKCYVTVNANTITTTILN